MREVGLRPRPRPGLRDARRPRPRRARRSPTGLASGDLHTVWLHHVDPLRNYPDRPAWERALGTAQTVIAVESQLTDTVREFADVVFPAEAYPEKEGTLTHPDGRLQRLRPAIGHPRGAGGHARLGRPPAVAGHRRRRARARPRSRRRPHRRAGLAAALFEAVPFYDGLTLEEIGGRGVRWVEREAFESPAWEPADARRPAGPPAAARRPLRLGTYRPLWAAKEVDISPALQFIRARQVAELSPSDAAALGINEGDRVEVGNGTRVRAQVEAARRDPGRQRVPRRGHRARTTPTC